MRDLRLTAPFMHGEDVLTLQQALALNTTGHTYYHGKLDGQFGPLTAAACAHARWWLGFPGSRCPRLGDSALLDLLTGKTKPTAIMERRRTARLARAASAYAKPKTPTFRDLVVTHAKSELGVHEWPAGSNWGPAISEFLRAAGIAVPAPWCAAFVTWVLKKAGYGGPLPTLPGYCPSWLAFAREHGLLIAASAARCGDIVLFQWGDRQADHIGFVTADYKVGKLVSTLEGNTGAFGGEVTTHVRWPWQELAVIDIQKLGALEPRTAAA